MCSLSPVTNRYNWHGNRTYKQDICVKFSCFWGRVNNFKPLYYSNSLLFQDKDEHLELMDGVIIDLLNAKWNTFVKFKFYRQFFTFSFYFLISLFAFTLRPGPLKAKSIVATSSANSTQRVSLNSTVNDTLDLGQSRNAVNNFLNKGEFSFRICFICI